MEKKNILIIIAILIGIIILVFGLRFYVAFSMKKGDEEVVEKTTNAQADIAQKEEKEQISLMINSILTDRIISGTSSNTMITLYEAKNYISDNNLKATAIQTNDGKIQVTYNNTGNAYIINQDNKIEGN